MNNFNQKANYMQSHNGIKQMAVRVRCIFHDAGILFSSITHYSLNAAVPVRKDQNELYFWKRDQGGVSNV